MTDPKAGIANIKKKKPMMPIIVSPKESEPAVFQRKVKVLVKVSDYNSKAGKMKL